jgi:lipid-A-disaccharide synthase
MKYFIIAGEASGDLHGANLVRELKLIDSTNEFTGWGGDLMIQNEVKVLKHIRELAFMGFVEVLANIKTIKKNFKICKEQILEYKPDAVIMIDYPGFNMRMSKWIRNQGIQVYYYISPNVWAWNTKRVFHFRDHVDRLFVILPFEKDFYAKFNIPVDYEGHPLRDAVENFSPTPYKEFCEKYNLDNRPKIAVLAGSRKQEINIMLPHMIAVAEMFPDYEFVIAGAPAIEESFYQNFLGTSSKLVIDDTYNVLFHAKAGIIKSGTSTLEAALFDLPQVVCYRSSFISTLIAYLVKKVKYISLVNLILNRESVKELLQYQVNKNKIAEELNKVLPIGSEHKRILDDYNEIKNMLGNVGATKRVAQRIHNYLEDAKK